MTPPSLLPQYQPTTPPYSLPGKTAHSAGVDCRLAAPKIYAKD